MMWLVVAVVAVLGVAGGAVPLEEERHTRITREQPTYGITHLDIRDAILTMDKSIKAVANKLNRHEAREAQVADFTTKTLNALSTDHSGTSKAVLGLAQQLAGMEERLLSLESLIHTTDERQRLMLSQISQGLDRLLVQEPRDFPLALPEEPEDAPAGREVKKMSRKLNQMEDQLERGLREVTNEVKLVGESMGHHLAQLDQRHKRLAANLDASDRNTIEALQNIGNNLARTADQAGGGCSGGSGGEVVARLDTLDQLYREQEAEIHQLSQDTHRSLDEQLEALQTLVKESHRGQASINDTVAALTASLTTMRDDTRSGLGALDASVRDAVQRGTDGVEDSVTRLEAEVKQGNQLVLSHLDDASAQAENLQNTVLENYSELSREIVNLKKVEQVMINTADAVLDTKRSIEYGIQQIIFELGDIVKNSGHTINSTLHDQISNVSFAILKNQTSALTNMTNKMEQEISQVWRQISILYQSMSQSVNILDELSSTTKEHMNASLSRVGDMDGTVGKINTKVADVESNLNYLLGRLSLVVSEFNLMKDGVGNELMRLKENLAQSNNPVFDGQQPGTNTRYDVNRKRSASTPASDYFQQQRDPLTVF